MTRFACFVPHCASRSVVRVLNAAARRDGCPEVIEHVTMSVPSFPRRQPNLPDPDPAVFAEQTRAHMSILRVSAELFDQLISPADKAAADQFPCQRQIKAVPDGRVSISPWPLAHDASSVVVRCRAHRDRTGVRDPLGA